MYQLQPTIDREYILSRVSEEQIMERFLGVRVVLRKTFCSPLRKDENPTCKFYYGRSGRLYLKDWSGAFHGDCFEVVMHQYCLDFRDALLRIAQEFNLAGGRLAPRIDYDIGQSIRQQPVAIQIKVRGWSQIDRNYWLGRFNVNRELLRFYHIYPVETAWVDDRIVYTYSSDDPCYAYRLSAGQYKLYFPYRRKDKPRFMGNTNLVQGYTQLPSRGNLLIITKSMKDVVVLGMLGFWAVAWQSESVLPDAITVATLKERFTRIYSLYDFDLAGIRTANQIKRTYGIAPIMLTRKRGFPDYGVKDAAEAVDRFGADVCRVQAAEFRRRLDKHESLWIDPLVKPRNELMDVPF